MAIKFANRVKVVTTTTGTGTITLGSAVAGFQTFADGGVLNGNSVRYTILDGDAWEVGVGVYSSTGPTMTRTLDESSTGSLLNLSGDCEVFITTSAVDIENLGSRSIDQFQFTATSSQTIFTGNDDNANQLAFFEDNVIVTLNGTVLELTTDYTVSGGDTITLTSGATAGDELNVVAFKSFTIADAVPTTGGAFTGNVDFGAGIDVTGNITVTGTVDGRDVAADGTKLDGIEAGATGDQTAAEILTAIKTVDGSGSGLDADLLDGLDSTAFATAAQGALADTAVQPNDNVTLGAVTATSFSGDGSALTNLPAGGSIVQRDTFTTSGTWTKPADGVLVVVELWGGGGGGAAPLGGGGGGGGYRKVTYDFNTLNATEVVIVGAGGAAGGSSGGSGGSSRFRDWAYTFITVEGGLGGTTNGGSGRGGGYVIGNVMSNFSFTNEMCHTGSSILGSYDTEYGGGYGGGSNNAYGGYAIYGGGGGGGWDPVYNEIPNPIFVSPNSTFAGAGGVASYSGVSTPGEFPSGGGAGTNSGTASAGADGQVIITVIK